MAKTCAILSLLLAAATAWAWAYPDRAIWNRDGYYSHAFGWDRGAVFFTKYGPTVGPPPKGNWVADNLALPPTRRWGWSACGVTRQDVLNPGGRQRTWTVAFPLAAPLAVTLFVSGRAAARALRAARQGRRRRRGLCPGCGYDLTGNTSGTCPECGSPGGSWVAAAGR